MFETAFITDKRRRSPGSTADQRHGRARLDGDPRTLENEEDTR